MERRLFLVAFVVCYGLVPVQLNKEMGTKGDAREVNGPNRIQEDFHNLLESIKRNDAKRREIYRDILKQEATREQQAFNTMKEELWFERQKNAKQKSIYIDEDGSVLKREITEENDESNVRTEENKGNDAENSASEEPFISKTDEAMGSDEKSTTKRVYRQRNFKWKSRAMSILKEKYGAGSILDATTYRIKNARTKPGPVSVNPLATDLEKRVILLAYLLDSFGQNDTEKKRILESEDSPMDMYGSCYITNWQTFMKYCFQAYRNSYKYMAGLLDVRNLLARACKADWIATNEMKEILLDACSMKRRLGPD